MTLAIDGSTVATSTSGSVSYCWNTTGLAAGSADTITATATRRLRQRERHGEPEGDDRRGGGDTPLTSGVAVTGQSVAKSAWKYYSIAVPSGATNLTLATTSATGDVDIYTQSGAKPTSSSYVCRPYGSTGNESCSATNPAAGTWWLGVYGYAAASYTVTGTYTLGGTTYSISGSAGRRARP